MKKLNLNIIEDLCNIYSPSGYENDMLKYIEKYIHNSNFDCLKTKKNSLFVYNKEYKDNVSTIMIDAHMDQVFLKIVAYMESGHIVALPVGFDGATTDGLILVHLKSQKLGTVETNPPHLNIDRRKSNEVYIDFGMTLKEAKKTMNIGDYIMFKSNFTLIGKNSISGTGLDNKIGIFILLELLSKFKNNKDFEKLKYNIIFHFSAREEIGLGSFSKLLTNGIKIFNNINEIITLDTIFITDSALISNTEEFTSDIYENEGPVITKNNDDDICLGEAFILLANKNKLKIQIAFTGDENGGSNNYDYSKYIDSYTQMIGIPLKHMHSPNEQVNINDIYNTFILLYKYLIWGNQCCKN